MHLFFYWSRGSGKWGECWPNCVTIGNLLNIKNTTSYTLNVSFGISLHFIPSPYIYVTPIMCKEKKITWHLGLGWTLIMWCRICQMSFFRSVHISYPICILYPVCSLHFIPGLHFIPSRQCAFCSLHFVLTGCLSDQMWRRDGNKVVIKFSILAWECTDFTHSFGQLVSQSVDSCKLDGNSADQFSITFTHDF